MAYRDLREFIEALESKGLLKRIKTEVDPDLEITEITDRVSKMKGKKNVALLFENVKGSQMPVLMNAFGSYERFEFYDEARKTYCILQSGETAIYANVILQKGVIK